MKEFMAGLSLQQNLMWGTTFSGSSAPSSQAIQKQWLTTSATRRNFYKFKSGVLLTNKYFFETNKHFQKTNKIFTKKYLHFFIKYIHNFLYKIYLQGFFIENIYKIFLKYLHTFTKYSHIMDKIWTKCMRKKSFKNQLFFIL